MRKISEMYKRSGGTLWNHKCMDCEYFRDGKRPLCVIRGDALWKPDYIACKFWKNTEDEIEGQLSIFDVL